MVYPIKELISTFLELEDEKKFTPMNEWQAYFFVSLVYPYIYYIALSVSFAQLNTIPIMMFWYLIDPEILVAAFRPDGSGVPRDNYAAIYAESDAIQALLFFDMRYLYKGKKSFNVSIGGMALHWLGALLILSSSWLLIYPMSIWLGISFFQVCVIYLYSAVMFN